jgi:hypothetical protein
LFALSPLNVAINLIESLDECAELLLLLSESGLAGLKGK